MQTEAELCNLALTFAQHAQTIDSLDEKTAAARACKVVYADTRDLLLRRFAWPWATKHVALALLEGVTRPGWTYAYALPTDCLKPQFLYAGARPGASFYPTACNPAYPEVTYYPPTALSVRPIPYRIELADDGAGQILLTDQEQPNLAYTAQVKVVRAFPTDFARALACQVGSDVARSLTKDTALAEKLASDAELLVQRAWSDAMNSQQADPQPESTFITARY